MTKRKQTGIEDIYHAIIRIETNGCTQKQIADELGVNRTTVSKWMEEEKREKIKKAFEENINGNRKNFECPSMLTWIIRCSNGINVFELLNQKLA